MIRPGSQGPGVLRPRLLFSTDDGTILEHPDLLAAADGGGEPAPLMGTRVIPLPRGSDLFMLPGRTPLGIDPETGDLVALEVDEQGHPVHAVAAFMAPAHTATRHACFETRVGAPALPLYSYAAIGYAHGSYWVAGRRVDPDRRQDPWRFDLTEITPAVKALLAEHPANRLVQQLRRCALEYQCRAAQNFFLGRHEAPLPTSIACNARCVGCISLQPDGSFKASHDRLSVAPTPEDVATVAHLHIARVAQAVVSFGQGCEGEPLMMGALLVAAVAQVRAVTAAGTINLNTNASLPEVVAELAEAGLDSMRVSLNSTRPDLYAAYYRPQSYGWDDVVAALKAMQARGRFTSLNLLYFPGVTDRDPEVAALCALIAETGIAMIQLRNMNIDPELYREILPADAAGPGMGLTAFTEALTAVHPHLRFGYFNPPKERYGTWRPD